jgi:hypothetical protein
MSRVLTYVLVAIIALAGIGIVSSIAWSNFAVSAGAWTYVTKADFDQAFADAAAGRRESNATFRDNVDGTARSSGGPTANVNRDRKSDRLPVLGGTEAAAPASTSNSTVVRKNAGSPGLAKGANGTPARHNSFEIDDATPAAKQIRARHCEPVASPFADPALGRIIGRCFA